MALVNANQFAELLELEVLYPGTKEEIDLSSMHVSRPGLQLSGFFDYFAADRVQVLGKMEMTYINEGMDSAMRAKRFEQLLSYNIPCLILSRNYEPPQELLPVAWEHGIPIYRSKLVTGTLVRSLSDYLGILLAPTITRHGVLVDVYGVGMLLTGDSGIGKSETALELIQRGHRLVADDVIEITRISTKELRGTAPIDMRHFMEIRGVGIIDIEKMFGIGSVLNTKHIDMVVELEDWNNEKEYDRLGLTQDKTVLLDVKLPKLVVPVRPGRNLAIIMEVASRNYRLRNMGYDSAIEFTRRMTGDDEH